MRLLKYTFLLPVLLLVVFPVFAQQNPGRVSGKLTDKNNDPVSYATVTLLRTDSTVVNGDLSKDDGSFNIASVPIGRYIVRIESVGADRKFINVEITNETPEKNLGKIKLSPDEHALKEVSITGEKPIMELKVDKKVFNVEKNTTTAGGSATDVLQNVPSVSVDADGTVNLRGKSDVTILIDGKPATMFGSDITSALQSLPAGSIESVEVITNPSAKYDAQGSTGIINIVTKKDGRFGINGSVTMGAGTNDKYNGNLALNARKGKWNVFLNSSARQNRTWNNVITDKIDRDSSEHTYEHVPRHFDGFFNTIGASYDFDKNNSVTVTENVNRMQFGYKDYSDYYMYSSRNENLSDSFFHRNRYTDFVVDIFSISSAVDYRRKFKKKDEELNVDFTYAHTDINKTQNFLTNLYTDTLSNNVYDIYENAPGSGYNNSTNIWADYTDPLFTKNGKLGLGFKSQFYDFYSTANPLIDTANPRDTHLDSSLLNNFKYTQQIHAGYVNWSDQLGKFSYQAGLRVEDAVYDGSGDLPTHASFHTSFFNLFPSAFISYQLGNDQSLYLNYSRRTNRPGFMQLLPFKDFSNPGTINMGNPGLIPEFINNIEFSYSKADNRGDNIILSAYYAYTENLNQRVLRRITDADSTIGLKNYVGSLLSQPVNISSGTTYGLEGTAHIQIVKIWDATVNINYFENQLNVGSVDPIYTPYLQSNNGSSWFGKLNTNLKLPKNFSLQVNANYESPKVVTEGHIQETYWMDVAIRKNFWKNKATLILNCSDVFNTHTNVTVYDIAGSTETINRIRETRIGNINFTYRFGKADLNNNKKAKSMDDKNKPPKPGDEERDQNLKQKDDNDQPGGGGSGGGGGQKSGNGANGGGHS